MQLTKERLKTQILPFFLTAVFFACSGGSEKAPLGPDSPANDDVSSDVETLDGAVSGVEILSATSDSLLSGRVSLVWSRYRGDDEFVRYRIERRAGDDEFAFFRSIPFSADTMLTDSGVAGTNTTWSYRIVTLTASGTELVSDPAEVEISLPISIERRLNESFSVFNLRALDDLIAAGGDSAFAIWGNLLIRDFAPASLEGLEHLVAIYGNLTIDNGDGLDHLMGLDNLRAVYGDVTIIRNGGLRDLTGLDGLTTIGGVLNIDSNQSLENLGGLDNLQTIYGGIQLSANSALSTLEGLSSLEHIEGDTYISSNHLLEDLALFRGLTTMGGLSIRFQGNLRTLDGLENLTSMSSLVIELNYELENLTGLSSLQTIRDSLRIWGNPRLGLLRNLEGLGALQSIGGNLTLVKNGISSLSTFHNLTDLGGSLTVFDNKLETLDGLNSLTHIQGDVEIAEVRLVEIEALSRLVRINGELRLLGNDALDNIEPLRNLEHIGGFHLIGNDALTSIEPLQHLFTELDFSLKIQENEQFADIDAFENLTSVGGDLSIGGSSISGLSLPSLERVGGDFSIESTVGVETLHGLENLTAIGGGLRFYSNKDLISLDGLDNLQTVHRTLVLWDNSSLSDIQALRNLNSIGGIEIFRNSSLVDLTGLNGITRVEEFTYISSFSGDPITTGGWIRIARNDNLESLAGLENVTAVEGGLLIDRNPSLLDVGLQGLTEIAGHVTLSENQSLLNLDGLGSLADVGGVVNVVENQSLTSTGGLVSLRRVAERLSIDGNPALIDLGEFTALETVGSLYISGNKSLPNRVGAALVDRMRSEGAILSGNAGASGNLPDPVLQTQVQVSQDLVRISTELDPPDLLDLTQVPLVLEALVDMESEKNLQAIEWDVELPPGASVELRTRTGNSVTEITRYFRIDGREVTEEGYRNAPSSFRGEILTYNEIGDDWTDWSESYEESGSAVSAPSGQRYVQIQVTYSSTDPTLMPTLQQVRISFSED